MKLRLNEMVAGEWTIAIREMEGCVSNLYVSIHRSSNPNSFKAYGYNENICEKYTKTFHLVSSVIITNKLDNVCLKVINQVIPFITMKLPFFSWTSFYR